jgi:hypothetical protein
MLCVIVIFSCDHLKHFLQCIRTSSIELWWAYPNSLFLDGIFEISVHAMVWPGQQLGIEASPFLEYHRPRILAGIDDGANVSKILPEEAWGQRCHG